MIRKEPQSAGGSPFLLEALERTNAPSATVDERAFGPFTVSRELESPPRMEPATAVDAQAAEPVFSDALRKRLFALLDATALAKAVAFNEKTHPAISGIGLFEICTRLEVYVERDGVAKAIGGKPVLADLVGQMAQQFQRKCFRETRFHTGKLDEPTLDALGFVRHRGRGLNAADLTNAAATAILRRALTPTLTAPLGADVTAATWFSFMLDAPFLGLTTRGGTGLHLELMRRLRTAQRHLWTQARYRDLSPVELGDALLWDAADDPAPHGTDWTRPADPDAQLGDRHRGARPGNTGASMHLAGLAVDLAYRANPWVGSASFKAVSGRAATLVGGSVTDAAGVRTRAAAAVGELSDAPGLGRRALHALSQGTRTTAQIHDALAQWNAWLEQYLALGASDAALAAAIAARQADGTPGVARRGASPARTLADWRGQIAADLASLRANSFSAAGTPRDPRKGFLSFHRDLVVALRDVACLAWGAVDIGAGDTGSGDMMHFDCRVEGIGRAYATATGQSSVPTHHPCIAVAPPQQREAEEAGPIQEAELRPTTPTGLSGKLFRLQSKQGGAATGVFVPPAAMDSRLFTVVLWMHGLSRRNGKFICGNADDAFAHLADAKTFPLMKLVEESAKPYILVVPSMLWSGDSHRLGSPKQMNLFLREVEAFLEEVRVWLKDNGPKSWREKTQIGHLILAGHSKAYVVLDSLACQVDDPESAQFPLARLSEVWSIDTMYGQGTCASAKWMSWAAVKFMAKFRVVYIQGPGSDTGPEGDRLFRKASASGFDQKNLKVLPIPRAIGDHCQLPAQLLPALLAGKPPVVPQKEAKELEWDHEAPRQEYDTPKPPKTPPKTPPSPPPSPPPVVDPPGKTLYADVPIHPAPARTQVGIFLPKGFRPTAEVDLLVFLRGWLSPCASPTPDMVQFWNTGLTAPGTKAGKGPVALRELVNASGKNFVFVAPSLGANSDAGALTAKGGFAAMVDKVLQTLQGSGLSVKPTAVRNIVFAAHSGGGAAMRQIMEKNDAPVAKLREVWGFDSMYDGVDPAAWMKWVEADPRIRCYFHFFVEAWQDNGTKALPWLRHEKMEGLATTAKLIGKRVFLEGSGGLDHCAMLLPLLGKRLAATTAFTTI